jgi:4-diphosphocytidyl-2-C-methyl-D-erythritol kinase
MPSYVVTRAPGKINLQLSVGPLQADGYHPVATVFQAVSLFDDVRISFSDNPGISLTASGKVSELLPLDKNNLAFKAAELMCKKFEITDGLAITLTKEIPIAGGMAGGSADAGATIVGIDALFGLGLSRSEMERIGSELGADIPFTISGGTAIGTGRGDRLREGLQVAPPHISDSLMQALSAGDAVALGKALSNDLQPAACSLKPALRLILDVGMDYGALGGLVSGSGPTVAFLAENEDHALDLVVALTSSGVVGNVVRAAGPVPGARVIESA